MYKNFFSNHTFIVLCYLKLIFLVTEVNSACSIEQKIIYEENDSQQHVDSCDVSFVKKMMKRGW